MKMHVVSTAFDAPTWLQSVTSVREQKTAGIELTYSYIDAARQLRPKTAIENIINRTWYDAPSTVVVMLDGDDWFPHENVLQRVAKEYADPDVWMTWGSYKYDDGRMGHAAPYADDEDVRAAPFKASHLKTYKAGLFNAISHLSLFAADGSWLTEWADFAFMVPMLEMAGPKHRRFIPEVLYTYYHPNSWEARASAEDMVRVTAEINRLRRATPYQPLVSL